MRQLAYLFFIGLLISFSSCRTDFETVTNNGNLKFSKDTIYLDTVFSTVSSSTYRLKVYNNSKNDITIPTIKLGKGLNSKYRMTVDGMQGNQGKLFENVNLLAKDSMYIFIETTASITDANPTDFLYTDQILFDGNTTIQKVELVTLIKDAVFLYPKRFGDGTKETITIENKSYSGFFLDENDPINGNELHFTKNKAYVIYGYAAIPSGKTAIFDPGARVYFHSNSSLIAFPNASINVNGSKSNTENLENEVIFEGDRLEPEYSTVPGQWGTIWLTEGSLNHSFNHATIKNASIGLLIQNTTSNVSIKNTQIYDCTNYGILAKNATITGENVVINSAGLAGLACTYGGNYKFTHSTFNNNWPSSSQTSVLLNNIEETATPKYKNLIAATFNNCIIYGSYSDELRLIKDDNALFNYQLNNCLLKSNNNNVNDDTAHYTNVIVNKDPKFLKIAENKLNIEKTSAAFAKGNPSYLIPVDVLGITRSLPPDIGAYQNKDFPKKK